MSSSTDDRILQQDMPQALKRVEEAAKLLEEAAKLSKVDPFSKVRGNIETEIPNSTRQRQQQKQSGGGSDETSLSRSRSLVPS